MSTDDEIRGAFHSAFAPAVGEVTVSPTMLAGVRRRHARQQRMLTVGAPLGVAVVTAGAIVGGIAVHDGSGATGHTTPAATGAPDPKDTEVVTTTQTLTLLDHQVTLPSDWTLSGNRKLIDLNHFNPPQHPGGADQSVTATSPDRTQQIKATIYRGPIAHGEYETQNPTEGDFAQVTIAGNPGGIATFPHAGHCVVKVTPANPQPSLKQLRKIARNAKPGHAKAINRPITTEDCTHKTGPGPNSSEATLTFANHDVMLLDATGYTNNTLEAFLNTALA
jgi:hypothetical protein